MNDPTKPVSASQVEAAINTHADAFEYERALRARKIDAERSARAKRTERQFWFLFGFMFLCFVLLAYRTETNNHLLQEQSAATDQRFYQACLDRQARQIQTNVNREELVQLAAERKVPPLAVDERAEYVATLRSALLVLVEECGDAPTSVG